MQDPNSNDEKESQSSPYSSKGKREGGTTSPRPEYNDYSKFTEEDIMKLIQLKSSQKDDSSDDGNGSDNQEEGGGGKKKGKKTKPKRTGPRGGVYEPFPIKLYRMLEQAETNKFNHVISWKPHGRAFIVNDSESFVSYILPMFFRQTKITSFQRQLNLYGFRRFTHGLDAGAYFHELFLRSKPTLCQAMLRTKVKGTKREKHPCSEPNFYENGMDYLPDIVPGKEDTSAPRSDSSMLGLGLKSSSDVMLQSTKRKREDDVGSMHRFGAGQGTGLSPMYEEEAAGLRQGFGLNQPTLWGNQTNTPLPNTQLPQYNPYMMQQYQAYGRPLNPGAASYTSGQFAQNPYQQYFNQQHVPSAYASGTGESPYRYEGGSMQQSIHQGVSAATAAAGMQHNLNQYDLGVPGSRGEHAAWDDRYHQQLGIGSARSGSGLHQVLGEQMQQHQQQLGAHQGIDTSMLRAQAALSNASAFGYSDSPHRTADAAAFLGDRGDLPGRNLGGRTGGDAEQKTDSDEMGNPMANAFQKNNEGE